MVIERVVDPLDEREWEPKPGALRVTFDTKELMRRAGIPSDMSDAADERYIDHLSGLAGALPEGVRVRTTGYRYGPAAGDADTAFIDLVVHGIALAQSVHTLTTALKWLRAAGALEIRISDEAAEKLGYWELERRGIIGPELISQQLVRARRGSTARYDGFVMVYRLPDARLATVSVSVDGILQQLSVGAEVPGSTGNGAIEPTAERAALSVPTLDVEGRMARTGDTRYFDGRTLPADALAKLGRRLGALFDGNPQFDVTRTKRADAHEIAALADLADESVKVHISLDTPRASTVTVDGSGGSFAISVVGMGGAQFDLIYGLVRETLGLGEERRPTGPDPDADI